MQGKSKGTAQTRIENLKLLLAQWGGPSVLARKLHYSGPSYLSQLISGNRPFTEKTARTIEAALDLPVLWLDRTHNGSSDIDPDLLASVVSLVQASLPHKGPTPPPRQLSEIITLVYEQAQESGTVDAEYLRRLIKLITKE